MSGMDQTLYIAAITFAGGLVGWLLRWSTTKSPRDVQGDAERRIQALEVAYGQLSLKVEGTHARHDEALENLTSAVNRLAERFERFVERFTNGKSGGN
jgi:hypothetical protein